MITPTLLCGKNTEFCAAQLGEKREVKVAQAALGPCPKGCVGLHSQMMSHRLLNISPSVGSSARSGHIMEQELDQGLC